MPSLAERPDDVGPDVAGAARDQTGQAGRPRRPPRGALGELDERLWSWLSGLVEGRLVVAQAAPQGGGQGGEGVDGDPGLGQVGRLLRQVDGGQLVEAHGVVGHDDRGGGARPARPGPGPSRRSSARPGPAPRATSRPGRPRSRGRGRRRAGPAPAWRGSARPVARGAPRARRRGSTGSHGGPPYASGSGARSTGTVARRGARTRTLSGN